MHEDPAQIQPKNKTRQFSALLPRLPCMKTLLRFSLSTLCQTWHLPCKALQHLCPDLASVKLGICHARRPAKISVKFGICHAQGLATTQPKPGICCARRPAEISVKFGICHARSCNNSAQTWHLPCKALQHLCHNSASVKLGICRARRQDTAGDTKDMLEEDHIAPDTGAPA